ncbi:hypothetical protein CGK18_23680 [Vibrio parahaemolyticus]|nr:hypothetical protein CGK18_23680 [Vibrio parahaemolyticus]
MCQGIDLHNRFIQRLNLTRKAAKSCLSVTKSLMSQYLGDAIPYPTIFEILLVLSANLLWGNISRDTMEAKSGIKFSYLP